MFYLLQGDAYRGTLAALGDSLLEPFALRLPRSGHIRH